jgi:putative MATE family efflux protein
MPEPVAAPSFASTFTRIFVPVAFQNLFFSLIGIIDVLLIGQLGDAPVAAVGLAGQFFFLLNLTLFGTANGAAVFAAQYWGARDRRSLHRVLGLCLSICLGAAVTFAAAALLFPESVMGLYTQDPVVVALGASYLRIIAWSYCFTAVTITFAALIRSSGNTRLPMVVAVATLSLNIVLDYCLIFGKLGLPALGVRGSALGTAISRGLECLALVALMYRRGSPAAAPLREYFGFNLAFAAHHLRLILLVFLNEFLWALGTNVYNAIMARLGTAAYAAYNISTTFLGVGLFWALGCTTTCGILVGYQVGAGDSEAAYRTGGRILRISVVGSALVGLALAAARQPLMDLYQVSAVARQDASAMLLIIGLTLSLRSLDAMFIVGILRSGGDTRYAAFLDVGGIWLAGIPAAALAAFVWHVPAAWVLAAMLAENLTKNLLAFRRYLSRRWICKVGQAAVEPSPVG